LAGAGSADRKALANILARRSASPALETMSEPADDHFGFLVSDAARLMRTVFDRRVRRLGLTRAQWLVLTRLHRRPGASQSELADMMEVEKATAGRLVDRLEAKGWVERRAQAGDRRVNRIYLTPEAERVHKRIWRVAEATVEDALSGLSEREAAQLMKLLGRVKGTLTRLAEANGESKPNGGARPAGQRGRAQTGAVSP
jgi:MarR family transcriptional regulator for hemolysin